MDRYDPAGGHRAAPGQARPDLVQLAAGTVAVLLAPAGVAMLRLFPPLEPAREAVEWLPPVVGGAAAAALGLGMVIFMARGLRDGTTRDLARAAGLGALTAGVAVMTLRAASAPGAFPDAGLATAAPVAAGLLLAGGLLKPGNGVDVRWSTVASLLLFGAIELALAGALLVQPGPELAAWLLGISAALAAATALAAVVRGDAWLPAGVLAGGLAALAAARYGSIDALPALVAIAGGGLASAAVRTAVPFAAGGQGETAAVVATTPQTPALDDDAMRLARELRGTIEELLHARRTIELQREELSRAATVDLLTGVATRRAILDRLRIEAAEARRYSHPVAMVLLDLDGFSELNRQHGMAVGDEVLREVALRLRLRIRAADALGREGGDSFLALLPHTDETGAALFADALRRRLLSRPIGTSAGELLVAVSIGVAFMRPGNPVSDEELLGAAEEALASARAAGGNRIAFDRAHGLVRLDDERLRERSQGGEAVGGS